MLLINAINFTTITWSDVLDIAIKAGIVIVAVVVLSFLIKWALKVFKKILDKKQVSNPFVGFIISITKVVAYVVLALLVLGYFNINTAPLLTVLGTFGLALGLALKDHMSNLASGILIIITKQFGIGDYISCADVSGSVELVELFSTKLISVDNKAIFVPNAKFTSNALTNYSREDLRRVDISIGVGYQVAIESVKNAMEGIVVANDKILKDPTHFIGLTDFGDSSVNFVLRVWVKAADYWDVYFSINEQIKKEFDKQSIEIPYPQLDVHMNK